MKRIVLCADDYGQAPHISAAIIELIQKDRISAVSCLVTSPHWQEHAVWLKPYLGKIDIGLHFNLTEGRALADAYRQMYGDEFGSLRSLLRKSFLRQLNLETVAEECATQVARFEEAIGAYPTYIDGHQHVHQFPIIRQAVLKIYKRYNSQISYIRLPKVCGQQQTLKDLLKVKVIHATGTFALEKLLNINDIPHNKSFAGIYTFSLPIPYQKQFQRFLQDLTCGGLLMCHPGYEAKSTADRIAHARSQEYAYLSSPQFVTDCQAYEIAVERFAPGKEVELK